MRKIIARYLLLPAPVLRLISAQLMMFMVNAAFMLIGNIYLRKLGYSDELIAAFVSYRFLGVLAFAFPLGLFIKGKRLKPFFLLSAIIVPLASYTVIQAINMHNLWLIRVGFLSVGIGFMLLQVCALPFIMRTAPRELLPEAISLSFATWSFAFIISGGLIALLSNWGEFRLGNIQFPWDEYHVFILIIAFSLVSILIFTRLQEGAPRSARAEFHSHFQALVLDYDWYRILKVLVPTMIVAVGAGLTIPFINLFFYSVFNIDSDQFSLLGGLTSVLVFFAALMVPGIRRRYGYYVAIVLVQGLSICFLIILALTEVYATVPGAVYVAFACFLLRQPLMNMAGPGANELTMYYVGEKNQELISAINSSIWSSAWYISAKIFQFLRGIDLPYFQIFLITAGLYAVGVGLYTLIIREYQVREKLSQANADL